MYTPRGRGYRGRGRGRASWYRGRSRGRGRGGYTSGTTVDNRPKQILVSGYEPSEKDAIVSHFTVSSLALLKRLQSQQNRTGQRRKEKLPQSA